MMMRKFNLLLTITLICVFNFTKAAILNVSNLPNNPFTYNNVDAAIAAAQPGDTIYAHGSNIAYPDFTITKSIIIIGTGGFPQTEFGLKSRFDRITFNSNISDVVINGIEIVNYHLDFISITNIHNVLITNCFFSWNNWGNIRFSNLINSSDIRIFNNVFSGGSQNKIEFGNNTGCFNIIIDHNIINGCIVGLNILNTVIQNNIFYNPAGTNTFINPCSLAIISNNIFFNADPKNNTSSCIFNNNISYSTGSQLTAMGGTNIDNTNPQFVNVPAAGIYSSTNNFNLQAGSPCIAAGSDGLNLGYYGGDEIVAPLGEPYNVPVIRVMNIQNPIVPQTGNVNVKVRSTKSRTN